MQPENTFLSGAIRLVPEFEFLPGPSIGNAANVSKNSYLCLYTDIVVHLNFGIMQGMSAGLPMRAFFDQLAEPFTGESVFDQLPDIVFFIKDIEGRYLCVNRTLAERCGLQDKGQLLGKKPSDVLGDTLGRAYEQQDHHVIRTGQRLVDQLELHLTRSRDVGWCLTTKVPLYASDGAIAGLAGVSQDLRLPDINTDDFVHIADAIHYAERNLAKRPAIRELARVAGMSIYQLDRRMRRVFRLTTGQWLLKSRISHASAILIETSLPIADVALRAGYADQSSFTRQFRRSTGLAPSEYRKLRKTA
jgi:AraC-like DNA-binding protein